MITKNNKEGYKKLLELPVPAAEDNTVLSHVPLYKPDGKPAREVWVHHDARYTLEGETFSIQPGQVALAWQREAPTDEWTPVTPLVITTTSAFVYDGRYMVKGGGADPKSHAKISDWEASHPTLPQHAAMELRYPGGVRRMSLQGLEIPALVARNRADLTRFVSTAKLFHSYARYMKLVDYEQAVVTLVTPADASMAQPIGSTSVFGFDILSATVRKFWSLPIPTIMSDVESEVLEEQPEGWITAVEEYLNLNNVLEVGVMRHQLGGEKMCQDYNSAQSQLLVRSQISVDALGMSVLDPDLYERLLPFQTGELNLEAFGA